MQRATGRHGARSVVMSAECSVGARPRILRPSLENGAWRPGSLDVWTDSDSRQLLLHTEAPLASVPKAYTDARAGRNDRQVRFAASDVLRLHLKRPLGGKSALRTCCSPHPWRAQYHALASTKTHSEQQRSAKESDSSGIRHQASYLVPALPIVFAHGLFGFDELILAPESLRKTLPGLSIVYWRGIADMLTQRGVEVLVTRVPMSASIEERAHALRNAIDERFGEGQDINVIGHSMGGLDARHLISHLETKARIRSLTTIASPHRGSTFADYMLDRFIGRKRLPLLLRTLEQIGVPGGGRAFDCLTRDSMKSFNEITPDRKDVHYLSWGAAFQPGWFNEFRLSHRLIREAEGDNDGLVSIESSRWGQYQGTLKASHLDLIGWTRKANSILASLTHADKPFDARAFYLTLCEDLALLGL